MASAFLPILQAAVTATPGAIGSALSATDGELVDAYGAEPYEWDIFSAHYGVILQGVQHALANLGLGRAHHVVLEHRGIDVLILSVEAEYYMVLATTAPMSIAQALSAAQTAAYLLREEMGF